VSFLGGKMVFPKLIFFPPKIFFLLRKISNFKIPKSFGGKKIYLGKKVEFWVFFPWIEIPKVTPKNPIKNDPI
jgi:hypothetical protein